MVCDEDEDGSHDCDEDAPQIHPSNSYITKRVKNRATDDRSNDPQKQIPHDPFAAVVHEFTSDVTCD
jgi:hypothetical protein